MTLSEGTQENKPKLSIITVFWNSKDDLEPYFSALQECLHQTDIDLEFIMVDNASTDGTANEIEKNYDWVTLIRNKENKGFSPGCNDGLEKATGDYILLLNPDCEARPGALSHLLKVLSKDEKIGAIGCTLLHGDGLPQHSHHREPGLFSYWATHSLFSPFLLRLKKLTVGYKESETPMIVHWLMGACIMTKKSVLDEVGHLDPEFFMYSEDSDLCRRMRDKGYLIIFDPRTWIVHHQGTTARRRAEFTFRRLYKSLLLYSQKHHGVLSRLSLRLVVCLDMILRTPIYLFMGEFKRLGSIMQVVKAFGSGKPDYIKPK